MRAGHARRGGFIGALVVALLASYLGTIVAAPRAGAALTNVWPSNGYGEIYADLTTGDALFAWITSDTRGGRVCVIAATGAGSCEHPAWGTPNIVIGVGSVFTLLQGPDLEIGTWRLRTESPTPGDGPWVEQATSDVFSVGPCVEDCDRQIGLEQARQFKEASGAATEFAGHACAALGVYEQLGTVSSVATGVALGLRVGGIGGAVLGGLAGGFIDFGSYNDAGMRIARMMACQVRAMHNDIANDPPAPDYATVEPPVFLDTPPGGIAALDELADALDEQAAYGIAARIAYERYQGALAAGDFAAQRLQASAAGEFAGELASAMRRSADSLRAAAAAAPGIAEIDRTVVETQAGLDALRAVAARVQADGFTAAETQDLRDLGFDDAEIAAIATWYDLDLSLLTPGETVADAFLEAADGFDAAVAGTDAFARSATAIGATDLAGPTASIDLVEYVDGDTRRFVGSGASADGDPIAYAWDFGDGTSATGSEVQHDYTANGDYTVRLTVQEQTPQALSAEDTEPVVVNVGSNPITAEDQLSVALGATASVNVLTNDFDHDGDALTLTGVSAAAGGTVTCDPGGLCEYAADAGVVGTEILTYTVSDGSSAVTGRLRVTIVAAAPPITGDLSVHLARGQTADVPTGAADPEPGPQPLVVEIVDPPADFTAQAALNASLRISIPFDAPTGTTQFTYRVTDGAQVSATATVSVTVLADNQAPTATNIDVATPAGVPLSITLQGSDPNGNPLLYSWSIPTSGQLSGAGPDLVFDPQATAPGTEVTFTYTANDASLASNPATVTVTIGPWPGGPIVDLGPDLDLQEGQLYFSAATRDPDGGPLTFLWDFGDGRTSTESSPSLIFDDGIYTVALTVTDSLDRSSTDTVQLRVRNVAPNASPAVLGPQFAGLPIQIALGASDPAGDPLTWHFDFGDGTTATSDTQQVAHTYAAPGTYLVVMTVADDDGAVAAASVELVIDAITADAGPDLVVPEGSDVTVPGTSNPAYGLVRYAWDFGDGTASGAEVVTHRWDGDEDRTLTLTVAYQGIEVSDEAIIAFENVAPLLGPAIPLVVEAGSPSLLLAGAVDPGGDAMTVTWDFGDGGSGTGSIEEHAWSTPGSYTVTVTAVDDEGAAASAITTVNVVEPGALADPPIESRGRSFHLAFDRNASREESDQYLLITGEQSTTGTVSVPGLGFRSTFSILAGRTAIVRLPDDVTPPTLGFGEAVETRVDPHAVIVHARSDVSVYGVNHQPFASDAFLALPDHLASLEGRGAGWHDGITGGQIDVVALEPDTTITVTVTGNTFVSEVLQPGDVLRVPGYAVGGDVTGVLITADKPVQILSGALCATIHHAFYCNHLVEAMWPTSTWGERFLTVPLAGRASDTFRVIANRDATEVSIDGVAVATLGPGQFFETQLSQPSEITTSQPALVVQYSNSAAFDNTSSDPFEMLVPPFEQWLDRYTVATVPDIGTNYLNVVILAGAEDTLELDGAPLDADFVAIGSSGYVAAQIPVTEGEHRITAARPFVLHVYGFDNFDGYGYPGGLALGRVADVTDVTLSPPTAQRTVGTTDCPTATVADANGAGIPGVRVDFEVRGVNPADVSLPTGPDGTVALCFEGAVEGIDELVARVGDAASNATRTWVTGVPENQPPTATAVALSTSAGTPVDVTLVATDPDGDPLSFSVVSEPTNGTLGAVIGNTVEYTPDPGFSGEDMFTFTASDGDATSSPANVTVTVEPPVGLPATVVVAPPSAEHRVGAQDCSTITVLDADATPLESVTVEIVRTGANPGSDTLETGEGGTAQHCYVGGAAGLDTLIATAGAASGSAERTWTANGAPTADAVELTTLVDTPVTVTLSGSDPDGDALGFVITSGPGDGTLGPVTGNQVEYTPAAGSLGVDTFTYAASDGELSSVEATVTITVVEPSRVEPATVLVAPPHADHAVGTQDCTTVTVLDDAGAALPNVSVQLVRTGANPATVSLVTGESGAVEHCYVANAAGVDELTATAGEVSGGAVRTWTAGGGDGGGGGGGGPGVPSLSACDGVPEDGFEPVEGAVHEAAIDCIVYYGLAWGYPDGTYRSATPTTRGQMASFVARLLGVAGVELPADPRDAFPGDEGEPHERAIDQLAALGLFDGTTGEDGGKYRPQSQMRRDDMAQFLANAFDLIQGAPLPPGRDAFWDDDIPADEPGGTDNSTAIDALAAAGVIQGVGGGSYDPEGTVSRGQMASYLARFLDLLATRQLHLEPRAQVLRGAQDSHHGLLRW